jgi:hypothetical protein
MEEEDMDMEGVLDFLVFLLEDFILVHSALLIHIAMGLVIILL